MFRKFFSYFLKCDLRSLWYHNMFFTEKGEIVLADYKTNRNTTVKKLTEEYRGQLAIYKKAIEEMTGLRVKECWLYSFSLGQCIMVEG